MGISLDGTQVIICFLGLSFVVEEVVDRAENEGERAAQLMGKIGKKNAIYLW